MSDAERLIRWCSRSGLGPTGFLLGTLGVTLSIIPFVHMRVIGYTLLSFLFVVSLTPIPELWRYVGGCMTAPHCMQLLANLVLGAAHCDSRYMQLAACVILVWGESA